MGCFRIEEIRDKDNEASLKEGGGIEMSTTVLSIYALHALFRFEITYRLNVRQLRFRMFLTWALKICDKF